jgi:hypothetical protein
MTFPTFAPGEVLGAADMNAVGLWKVTPTSVVNATVTTDGDIVVNNGVASFSVNGAFKTDYDYYKIHFLLNGSTSGAFARFRVRSAGSDIQTGTYYRWGFSSSWNGVLNNYNAGAQQQFDIVGQWGASITSTCWMEIAEPMSGSLRTRWKAETNDVGLGAGYYQQGLVEGNRQDDGFTVFTSAGNFSQGIVRVYGYRN